MSRINKNVSAKHSDILRGFEETQRRDSIVEAPPTQDLSIFRNLLFLGKKVSKIELEGFSFHIKTLNANERRELISRLSKHGDNMHLHIRPLSLAVVVTEINGVSPHELYRTFGGTEVGLDPVEMSAFVFSQLQVSVVEKLFTAHEDLQEEVSKTFDAEAKKK